MNAEILLKLKNSQN